MMSDKVITVNKKGMITIPVEIRKKYGFHEGSQIMMLDINGSLQIIPIVDDFEALLDQLSSTEEKEKIYEEARKEELRLENMG